MSTKQDRVFKLSQDAANEIWSVTLRRDYATPGEKKRAIEREIREALERLAGLKPTTGGHEDGCDVFGRPAPMPTPNTYANTANAETRNDD